MGSKETSEWSSIMMKVIIISCVAFVLVMFGSRFATLRFGQVFPYGAQSDHEKIVALEKRVSALEAERRKMLDSDVQNFKDIRTLAEIVETFHKSYEAHLSKKDSAPAHSQQPLRRPIHKGSSRAEVRRAFGRPLSVQTAGPYETWFYPNSKTVGFKDGIVEGWEGLPIEP